MYFLNTYSFIYLKSCISVSKDRVLLEQFLVTLFLPIILMHLQKIIAHIYTLLQAVKLLFHYINYPPDIQPYNEIRYL